MIHAGGVRRPRGRRGWAAALGLVAVLGACAPAMHLPARPPSATLAPGSPLRSFWLPDVDAWLRHYLMQGDHDAALALLERRVAGAPRDELQRALQRGVVLHYAGRYEESNQALAWAEQEVERRYTRSVTRAAGSLLINDGVLAFVPLPAEAAMLPYYRMQNYLALGDLDAAQVEARRAGQWLARRQEQDACAAPAFLHYLNAQVFAAGGERNDALVAMRLAERSYDGCAPAAPRPPLFGEDLFRAATAAGVAEVADSAARRYGVERRPLAGTPAPSGDLVLLLEHGFVAFRAEQELQVPIYRSEVDGLDHDDEHRIARAASLVGGRLVSGLSERQRRGDLWVRHPRRHWADHPEDAYYLRLAWPVFRLEASQPVALRVLVDDAPLPAPVVGDLSSAVVRDFRDRQALLLARAATRAMVKYLLTEEVRKKAEKQGGEVARDIFGGLMNLAGNALERADTRGWTLLPDRISVARLTLPPGEHRVAVEVLSGADGTPQRLDLGTITVRPGERVFLHRRLWGDDAGDDARLRPLLLPPLDSAALAADSTATGAAPADTLARPGQ